MNDARLIDEAARLRALKRYEVLDTQPEAPFDRITALVKRVLTVPVAAVSLLDADRQWFKARFGLAASETPRDIAFCAHTIRSREVFTVSDARCDARFAANPLVTAAPHIRSYAGVPLVTHDGYAIGALCVLDQVPREFTPAQLELLAHFGDLIMGELELRQIAGQDHLTGALTRRGFLSALDAEIAVRHAIAADATLMMFDLDHFKAINDRFGHGAGDVALNSVVQTCRAVLRGGGIVGRLGGEEFGVLLPRTSEADGLVLAERLRVAIATSSTGLPLSITASFGVQPLRSTITTATDWMRRADALLYLAKRNGRNRCEAAEPCIAPAPACRLAA